ncbi:hypothetical protein [Bacillus sp. NPDC077027]|uniref:hypothetical protein n=1 Tax=Bacillus sp. NPDC077027 TaxID=3390548 RepID=UPI003D0406FC
MKKHLLAFDSRSEAQRRLIQAGGWIAFEKGRPIFQFATLEGKQRYLQLGREAFHRKNHSS